jgi:site-specific DNA-methyltransferase (adenine-specific)
MMNTLYYGENLNVLREHITNESIDLIYLDPPFNSKRDYNLLFKSPGGPMSKAQIEAFEDTWHWNEQAEREFDEILHQSNTDVSEMMQSLRRFLGENDMMAYLIMMANRLIELRSVLKSTGSLYLHCDPTASHYLKIVLDGVFGKENFKNEIIWQRTNSHNAAGQYGRIHDTIFFYVKTSDYKWRTVSTEYSAAQLKRYNTENGRLYTGQDLTAPRPDNDSGKFEWRGTMPSEGRGWGYTVEQLEEWWNKGLILTKQDGTPRMDGLKKYLDEMPGKALQSIWYDIPRIANTSAERLGYPTQKPLALLERIISVSSNEGDVVLDPFCGCGTAIHAAQKLNRKWIGIDITHLAISLIEKRLKDSFKTGLEFEIHGTPKDLESARDLAKRDKYQFQWWAVSLVEAQPFQGKKKGADTGIDGIKYFRDLDKKDARKIVVSIKGGENLKADDVRALNHVREREKAEIALFISLEETTRGMKTDAASAGFYESPTGRKFPRVQLLTIEGLLNKSQRAEHPDYEPNLNFKKAKVEATAVQEVLNLKN